MKLLAAFRRWFLFFFFAALALRIGFYFDADAQAWIAQHQYPSAKIFMGNISRFGDWPEHVAIGFILLVLAWSRQNKKWMRIFSAMLLACALAGATARVVKISAGRARPAVQTDAGWNGPSLRARYNAFPSGHTAASTAFFAVLVAASWRISATFLLIPALIAFSRMYVGAHYLSDVVCAALLGILCALLALRLLPISNQQSAISN